MVLLLFSACAVSHNSNGTVLKADIKFYLMFIFQLLQNCNNYIIIIIPSNISNTNVRMSITRAAHPSDWGM